MIRYRGLTWDHPRGFNALAAAAARLDGARDGIVIEWDKQPLEGFESHPIDDVCARYDLVVLDHPHVGEAVAKACLIPLEDAFSPDDLAAWSRETIGPCLTSYRYAARHWALPLDAATQVMALRFDVTEDPPETWDDVVAWSSRIPVALPMAGPHPVLTFFALASALGEPPAEADPELLVSNQTGSHILDVMATIHGRMPAGARALNPIELLQAMAAGNGAAVCPLVYGYVNYAAAGAGDRRPLAFHDAPRAVRNGRPGSTLGGTGVGISRRCRLTPALLSHLRWLLSAEAQIGFIPLHDGQPSRRDAWYDDEVNGRCGDFYKRTAETVRQAYVRPRYAGYIAFQTEASELLRQAFAERIVHGGVLDCLQASYLRSRPAGAEHWCNGRYRPLGQAMTDHVTFDLDGSIATITLNRPQKLNAVTPEMADAITAHVERCNGDDAIRCVIITGAGEKAFCAGSDIGELDRYDTAWNFRNRPDYCDAIRSLLKPTIAAVNGYAFGGGLETAMSCDIRLASETAQFAAPEIKLGWIGGGGMATFLAHSIGPSNAALMIMTGDPIQASQALAWGLVSEIVPAADLMTRSRMLAATIASRAPIAAETAKLNIRAAFDMSLEKAIAYERDLQTICFATEDAAEGRAAFKQKRAPVFRRR